MTAPDPVMRRLVDVNPAPEDFELPPVSDAARYETILDRGRSEESRSKPVLLRSWRPGLVVAAAAFAVVVVTVGLLALLSGILTGEQGPVVTEPPVVTTVAPAPTTLAPVVTTTPPDSTTVPPVVEQYEIVISDLDDGSFLASGAAVDEALACREGTTSTVTITEQSANWDYSNPGAYADDYTSVEQRTLTCEDGGGSIVLGMLVMQSESMSGYSFGGEWLVASGTGAYESVAGGGTLAGGCDSDRANCSYEYAGHLDRSRLIATVPIVPTPTGRHGITINYNGGWQDGPFTATGAAVSVGHFCRDGTMLGSTRTDGPNGKGTWKHTFFCADGTGRVTLAIEARESAYGGQDPAHSGTWSVMAGAGAYELVTGAGELSGQCLGGIDCSWTYTGNLEILEWSRWGMLP